MGVTGTHVAIETQPSSDNSHFFLFNNEHEKVEVVG